MIKAKYTVVLKELMDNAQSMAQINAALATYPLYEKRSKEEFIPSYIPTREELNAKLLKFYKYREIGFDTFGRFLDELETAMVEIMPRYNLLFVTADQDFNIIWNVDYKKTFERTHKEDTTGETDTTETGTGQTTNNSTTDTTETGTGQTTNNSTTDTTEAGTTKTDNSEHRETDFDGNSHKEGKTTKTGTPQGNISVPASGIDTVSHADEVTWNKDNNTDSNTELIESTGSTDTETNSTGQAKTTGTTGTETSSTGKATTTGSTDTETNTTGKATTTGSREGTASEIETTKGNFGVVSAQDLILKYRETILNIEQMIINDPRITELFMLVY